MSRVVSGPGWSLLLLLTLACSTTYERGESLYREGDRIGALETWRGIPADNNQYPLATKRIAEVEGEFDALVVRYKQRGRYYEQRGRLAESALNYRLALKLQPEDRETLDHLQQLVRQLDERKRIEKKAVREGFDKDELGQAREHLEALRKLDPFDPEVMVEQERLDRALDGEVDRLLARGRRGFTSGNYKLARRSFSRVIELDPQNDAARGYLSYIKNIRTRESEAGVAIGDPPEVGASEGQIRAEGHYQNALAAERRGDPYAAIEHCQRALELEPRHQGARRQLADLRASLEDDVPELLESGREHFEREDLHGALDLWRRVLVIDPGNEEARDYVARAETLLSNLELLRAEPTQSP